jgi:riboflavin synthase alpha subunit
MRRTIAALALVLAALGGTAGCEDTSAGCASHTCYLNLSDGESITVGGVKLTVQRVDDTKVTFDSHGVSLTLTKSTDLGIGKYHLHLGDVNGSSAGVSVSH